MSKKAYSYVRMSTAEQLRGDSLRRQLALSERYAKDHGLDLVPENQLQDIGLSAFSGEHITHGAFGVFLEKVRTGEIERGAYLLVESLDRLSRLSIIDALQLFLEIIKSGVVLVTLMDQCEYREETFDQFRLITSIIYLIRANEESQTKSRRVREAWQEKRSKLAEPMLPGNPDDPVVIKRINYTSKCPAWLKPHPDGAGFAVIPDRATVVRTIFRLARDQGSFSITRYLNQSKTKPFGRSKRWHKSYVTKILASRATYGEFQPHHMVGRKRMPIGPAIDDYFPPIIDKSDFLIVQSSGTHRLQTGRGRKGASYSNLFTGLATCMYCGSRMYYVDKGRGPKGGAYLQCSQAQAGGDCQTKVWRYADFETSFLTFVREIDLQPLLTAAVSEDANVNRQRYRQERELLRAGLVDEQRRAWQLNAERPIAFLQKQLASLQDQIDKIDAELAQDDQDDLDVAAQVTEQDAESLRQAVAAVTTQSTANSFELRARLSKEIHRLVARLTVGTCGRIQEFIDTARRWVPEHDEDKAPSADDIRNMLGSMPDQTAPFFRVQFKDGGQREVVVDPENPSNFLADWDRQSPKNNFERINQLAARS